MKKNTYLTATQCGGLMESPEIWYCDFDIIKANNEQEALEIYNKKHNSKFFYGTILDTNFEKKKSS